MCDIDINAIDAVLLHLIVDGAGDDVARGEFAARIVLVHEARAVGQAQQAAFTTYGLGDEKGLGLWVIKTGRMELNELHVRDAAAGAPCHGNAVAGAGIGVGGVKIGLACAAGSEDGVAGPDGNDMSGIDIEYVGTPATLAFEAKFGARDEIDPDVIFEYGDVGVFAHFFRQSLLHGGASGISSVDDAAVTMPAFAREVEAEIGLFVAGKWDTLGDQPAYRRGAVLDDVARGSLVAEACTGVKRVPDMGLDRIGIVEYGGNPTLSPCRGGVFELALGDECHLVRSSKAQGQ